MKELGCAEIACLLDLSVDAARQRDGRALLCLRKVLKEHDLLEAAS